MDRYEMLSQLGANNTRFKLQVLSLLEGLTSGWEAESDPCEPATPEPIACMATGDGVGGETGLASWIEQQAHDLRALRDQARQLRRLLRALEQAP